MRCGSVGANQVASARHMTILPLMPPPSHAYVPVVNLQVKKGEQLSPDKFAKQHRDALREIATADALSFTAIHERTGAHTREIYHVRCGGRVGMAFCLRHRSHDGDCAPKWEYP